MSSDGRGPAAVLAGALPAGRVRAPGEAGPDYGHDEALGLAPGVPAAVVTPASTAEVATVLRLAVEAGFPVTPRGSGTGLSGAAIPADGAVVVSFEDMAAVVDLDVDNQVAVVQPGLTLAALDEATAAHGLMYPVYPGEYSASIGGNIATNAGGMRAVKYGVTRHQVLGVEAVLPGGEVIRTGGRYVKGATGYDLTQLVIGSEGTLAVVTEAVLRLYPRAARQATVLAPFATLEAITAAVPRIVASGIDPVIVEYVDMVTLAAITAHTGLELGLPESVRERAFAHLVVVLEGGDDDRLDTDVARLAGLVDGLGALDTFVLPGPAAADLIRAREQAFWVAKANGADDIVDIVVPRAAIAELMSGVAALARDHEAWVAGCGHAGDGNVHLSVFQGDAERRHDLLLAMFRLARDLGGAISGEHGIGRAKRPYLAALEDPVKLALLARIKAAFDPTGILNPGVLLPDPRPAPAS